MRALIVVDVQNDFCEGGSLGVTGGAATAAAISEYVRQADYDHVVATRDMHVAPGGHFSDTPDFIDTWPVHCVAGTPGSSFHPALDVARIEAVFDKGHHAAAYSGFEGCEPGRLTLVEWLRAHDVDSIDIAGLATDHCVKATALDARRAGLDTGVLLELCAGVLPATTRLALVEMREAGVVIA